MKKREEKVYWLIGSEEDKPYSITTWYRCFGVQDFVEKVEEKNRIVGIILSDNNLGFILEERNLKEG